MIKRGIVISVPDKIETTFKFAVWLYLKMHRYYYPYYILLVLIQISMYFYMKSIEASFLMLLFIEAFYFSVALHEAFHFSVAKFVGIKTSHVSIVPYKLQIRTYFSKEKAIPKEDLIVILLSGPILSLLLLLLLVLIRLLLSRVLLGKLVYFIAGIMSIINIMSLLPFKESDGGRVHIMMKQNKSILKNVCSFYIYYISVKIGVFSKKIEKNDDIKE